MLVLFRPFSLELEEDLLCSAFFPRMSYQASIDSRAAESSNETTGGVGVDVLTRSKRRAMVIVPAEPVPQQSTSQDPEITTDQAQLQEQGQAFAELPELSEYDEDGDWESDIELTGPESTTSFSGSVSALSASTNNHSRNGMKRRQRSRESHAATQAVNLLKARGQCLASRLRYISIRRDVRKSHEEPGILHDDQS